MLVHPKNSADDTPVVYKGEFEYSKLEEFLSKYAEKETSSAEKSTITMNEPDDNSPVKKVPIKNLIPQDFEEKVYAAEGLVLVHFFIGKDFHKTFSDVFSRHK